MLGDRTQRENGQEGEGADDDDRGAQQHDEDRAMRRKGACGRSRSDLPESEPAMARIGRI